MTDVTKSDGPKLGKLVKAYKLSSASRRDLIIVMLVSGGIAAMFLLPVIFDSSLPDFFERFCLLGVGLFILLPTVFGARKLVLVRGVSLSLYENGLIYRVRDSVLTTTWDDIESYQEESACRITKRDGEVIEFGLSIDGADDVMETIRDETLRRLLPKSKAAILKGETVQFRGMKLLRNTFLGWPLNNFASAFAGFSVDAHGITELDSGKRIAWNDITDYGVADEQMGRLPVPVFYVQDSAQRFRTRLGLLSNAHVLQALCAEMITMKQVEQAESPS